MKRRAFLVTGALFGVPASLYAKAHSIHFGKPLLDVQKTIAAVQEHLFPVGSSIPSARSMYAIEFLMETLTHATYDRDLYRFVIEGAEELERREKGAFGSYSTEEKERALRAYEESSYGSSWLSRIMILTMEGIFSDPIYGSNIKEAGWRALGTESGHPRPKTRYIDV